MNNTICELLVRASKLLRECGLDEKADWFDERCSVLRQVPFDSKDSAVILDEIDNAIAGMGSFVDMPLSPKSDQLTVQQARDEQWELAEAIGTAIEKIKTQ